MNMIDVGPWYALELAKRTDCDIFGKGYSVRMREFGGSEANNVFRQPNNSTTASSGRAAS
ncbi:hypothetical protein E4U36_007410 [Claviceps purpurea]|nr:hypothetical protein E4U36_007410 [Claviceps purpurea]